MLAMTIEALPAGRGDCLWVECLGPAGRWRLLVDGGLPESWPTVRARIERLPLDERHIDLAVVSHIDADHIGGMLALFADTDLGVTFGDVWFNGRPHLPDERGRTRSVTQGESLMAVLSGAAARPADPLPWNAAFDGGPVMAGPDGSPRAVERPPGSSHWPAITVLGPQPKRLARLAATWAAELDRVRGGESSPEDLPPAAPEALDDLATLATVKTSADRSVPNGSSIVLLLEHRGARCLLTGDAFVSDLHDGLRSLAAARGAERFPVDVFKLPHHGSRGNVSRRLVDLAPARHYLVSTNGDRFDHPDDIALARVLTAARPGATLWFNYDTAVLRRWADPDLEATHHYTARYPDADDRGVLIELEATT